MRISLNNIREIERYIEGTMEQREVILFEEKVHRDSLLRLNITLHKNVLALVHMYHRKKLKMELEDVHQRIFNDPEKVMFVEEVMGIFGKGG